MKKVGGWGWQNAYVCLQGGWVGVAKCLRNYNQKDQIDLGEFWVLDRYKFSLSNKIWISFDDSCQFSIIFAPNQDFSCAT